MTPTITNPTIYFNVNVHNGDPMVEVTDPFALTDFNRPLSSLESMLLFSLIVAGKRADFAVKKLALLLANAVPHYLTSAWRREPCPFEKMRYLVEARTLGTVLRRARTGQYVKLNRAIHHLCGHADGPHAAIDLRTCSVKELEAVPGIGPKTARMFLLHSRADQRVAVLDVHILRWLKRFPRSVRRRFGVDRVPPTTPPSGKVYDALEQMFLAIADAFGRQPAALDLEIWRASTRSKSTAGR